jgi:hypothetical protein
VGRQPYDRGRVAEAHLLPVPSVLPLQQVTVSHLNFVFIAVQSNRELFRHEFSSFFSFFGGGGAISACHDRIHSGSGSETLVVTRFFAVSLFTFFFLEISTTCKKKISPKLTLKSPLIGHSFPRPVRNFRCEMNLVTFFNCKI